MISRLVRTALLVCFSVTAFASSSQVPNAQDLMARNFMVSKISAFKGDLTMTLINNKGQERVRKLAMWSKLKEGTTESEVMIRFEEPSDIRGTGFLQIEHTDSDDNLWVYLPALGKIRRLLASNKSDSFFGTDFSYGDVLLPKVDKYEHQYLRTEMVDGRECDLIESKPIDSKIRKENGYSRKLIWLDKETKLEKKILYYDLNGELLKTQTAYDMQEVEPKLNRWLPMRREMVNHQTGHKTIYTLDSFALDKTLTESYFSARNLER